MESVTDTLLSGPHAMGNTPSTALSEPNAHGVDILVAPENTGNLPVLPDASEDDEITMCHRLPPSYLIFSFLFCT